MMRLSHYPSPMKFNFSLLYPNAWRYNSKLDFTGFQGDDIDVTVPANSEFRHATIPGHTVLAYITDGQGYFCKETDTFTYEAEGRNYFDFQRDPFLSSETVVLFDDGDEIVVLTETHSVRFLLISGKPLGESVAWYDPIVMNTNEELQIAFEEYKQGSFIV